MARADRPPARVACVLVPDVAYQVMARARPALARRPAAVVRDGRVVAGGAAAAAAGVVVGLTAIQARSRCPALALLPADEAAIAAAGGALLAVLDRFSPLVAAARAGVAFADWGGLGAQPDGEVALARRLLETLRAELGLAARVGIADGPFVAAVAAYHRADAGRPFRVPPGAGAAFLAPFATMILPGVGARLAARLRDLGLADVGSLARVPPTARLLRADPVLLRAHRLANGADARPLRPHAGPAERARTIDLDPPEDSLLRLLDALRRAARPLWDDLEAEGLTADRLVATLHAGGAEPLRLTVPLPAVDGADRAAIEGLRAALDGATLPAPVAALTVTRAGVGWPLGRQLLLTEAGRAARRPDQLAAVARLWALLGPAGALRLEPRPARLPEDALAERPWDDAPNGEPPDPAETPRLLAVPPGLRWATPARPAVVRVADGRPVALREGTGWRRLNASDGPYRVETGWWAAAARPVARDYWLAADADGGLLLLAADHGGDWLVAGEID
ncbi:MAG: hypothetical protein IT340_22485 [Chloroflexi bacterium]|nr:hypothetical protein [Chloroflexota bacterium]